MKDLEVRAEIVLCFVQIPTLAVFALDYLYDVFPVFGPSEDEDHKCVSNLSFHHLMGHTYSVVKMQAFTKLYFNLKYFAF